MKHFKHIQVNLHLSLHHPTLVFPLTYTLRYVWIPSDTSTIIVLLLKWILTEAVREQTECILFIRIDFKILLITFKARLGLAPIYITDMLTPYEPARSLRSRSFNLPEEIRLACSVSSFKSLLKTHFYRLAFMWCHLVVVHFIYSIFCLLLLSFILSYFHLSYLLLFLYSHYLQQYSIVLYFHLVNVSLVTALCVVCLVYYYNASACFVCQSTL